MMNLMRTTLDIDPDVLEAAKEISSRTKRTAGQVLSELARKALSSAGGQAGERPTVIHGFEIIQAADRVVTPELVRKLAEEADRP